MVVLGGTIEENVFNTTPNESEFKAIFKRCKALVPSLEVRHKIILFIKKKNLILFSNIKNAKLVQKAIGFRPARVGGVRLEMEIIKTENGPLKVIHNYGEKITFNNSFEKNNKFNLQ